MSLKIKWKNFQVSVNVGQSNQVKIKLRKFNKPGVSKPSLAQNKNVLKSSPSSNKGLKFGACMEIMSRQDDLAK